MSVDDGADIPITPELSPDKKVEQLLDKGIEQIKEGNYQEAINLMRDGQVARNAGVHWKMSPEMYLIDHTPKQEEVKIISDLVANASIVFSDWIQISNIQTAPAEITGNHEPVNIPESLWHNVALVHAEEWHHVLYNLKGKKPLAGGAHYEDDVALYLHTKGVPLTEEFIDRYDRREALVKAGFTITKEEPQPDKETQLGRAELGEKADELNRKVQAWADRMRAGQDETIPPLLVNQKFDFDGTIYLISHSQKLFDRRSTAKILRTEIEVVKTAIGDQPSEHKQIKIESADSLALITASGTQGFDGGFITADIVPDDQNANNNKLIHIKGNNIATYEEARKIIDELTGD